MTYSTGDSFGHGSGYGEILWVFEDADVARHALKAWQEQEIVLNLINRYESGERFVANAYRRELCPQYG
jgi:hypothetical protein